jgi:hypothetical protein
MTFELDVTTAAAPDVVVRAVSREAAYWQESLIPSAVRDLGVLGVKAQVRSDRFELSVEDLGRDPPPTIFVLRGRVTALTSGGSRVQAWPAASRGGWPTAALAAGVAIWLVMTGSLILGSLIVVGSLIYAARVPTPSPNDAAVQHLVDRLSLALESAERQASIRVI